MDVDEAVSAARMAATAARDDQAGRPGYLSSLVRALLARFERTGAPADLDEAIVAGRQAVAGTPAGHPDLGRYRSDLGVALRMRFGLSETLADLDEAVSTGRLAVAAAPGGHRGRAACLSNLGVALQVRFERLGAMSDLDEAISAIRQAAAVTPENQSERGRYLSNLGLALRSRFEHSGDPADLDEAIAAVRQAMAATPDGDQSRAVMLANLGLALRTRFAYSGAVTDLDAAISAQRQAVAAIPDGHRSRPSVLSNLGLALQGRFEHSGDPADLDEAIADMRLAADADSSPAGHAADLSNLGAALVIRFEQFGAATDLDAGITAIREGMEGLPDAHPYRVPMLSNLGVVLRMRFELSATLADLDDAISAGRLAVAAVPRGHRGRAGYLSNLGVSLRMRFERSGSLTDLDDAIGAGRQAVDATSPGAPEQAAHLSNLGVALLARSRLFGTIADLDEAITVIRGAVGASPARSTGQSASLSNLSSALLTRFERSAEPADLDAAVSAARQVVTAVPVGHPALAGYLCNLCWALRVRFEHSRALPDIDEAVSAARQAVAAAPYGHRARTLALDNLGAALMLRFERLQGLADINEAVDAGRLAVAGTPDSYRVRAGYLSNLVRALTKRFGRTGSQADVDEAIAAGRQGAAMPSAPPRTRVQAAAGWGSIAALAGRWHEAAAGFDAAVSLLGRVSPRSLVRRDQEHALESLAGLASDAAACCVRAGLTERAVELLELGRGILLGQALDTRTDLTDLASRHPILAERFTTLRDVLDTAIDPATPPVVSPARGDQPAGPLVGGTRVEADRQQSVATAFDQVIAEIREQPGFAGFLRPPEIRDLLDAAADGPVVIVNVSRFGSHALIMTPGRLLRLVPLDRLTLERTAYHTAGLLTALDFRIDETDTQTGLTNTLGWLWDTIASPVLDELGLTRSPGGQSWPRIWWCLPGPLSFLPLHAAGRHHTRADPEPQTVMDRAVSSYTPTIRALLYARMSKPATTGPPDGDGELVVVAMPVTAGASDLPGAEREAAVLRQLLGSVVRVLIGPQATPDAAVQAIARARWAHFACHAAVDPSSPSQSRLYLADGQLTVSGIARLRLRGADLAFLSACSTAQPGTRLTDEAIHLASAFQLAGYRQVIATLWPIADLNAFKIARDLYTTLVGSQTPASAAPALHAAVCGLRDQWPDRPLTWASHMHSGA